MKLEIRLVQNSIFQFHNFTYIRFRLFYRNSIKCVNLWKNCYIIHLLICIFFIKSHWTIARSHKFSTKRTRILAIIIKRYIDFYVVIAYPKFQFANLRVIFFFILIVNHFPLINDPTISNIWLNINLLSMIKFIIIKEILIKFNQFIINLLN